MPDVLILGHADWANTAWRFFKCLQHLKIDVMALKGEYHRMAYPEQIPIHPTLMKIEQKDFCFKEPRLVQYSKDAKVIHYFASKFIFCGVDPREKKVVMQHGGTLYRNNFQKLNEYYNPFVDATIIQCPDLLGLGANNEHWIYYPVDTEYIQPDFTTGKKLVIGHFPSNPEVKGTKNILRVIKRLEESDLSDRFEYVGNRKADWGSDFIQEDLVLWTDNLKRLAKCDIVIETCNDNIYGRKYGEWGNTAIEAAALGKIVVTNSLAQGLYEDEYGICALNIANHPDALEKTLRRLLSLSNKEIRQKKQETRCWVEAKHSIPATAKRLWEKVYRGLLNG